jgi:hypothetical protein
MEASLGSVHGLRNLPGHLLQEGLRLHALPSEGLLLPNRAETVPGSGLPHPLRAGNEDCDLQRVRDQDGPGAMHPNGLLLCPAPGNGHRVRLRAEVRAEASASQLLLHSVLLPLNRPEAKGLPFQVTSGLNHQEALS